jgi:hypothetical protein
MFAVLLFTDSEAFSTCDYLQPSVLPGMLPLSWYHSDMQCILPIICVWIIVFVCL